MKWLKNFRRSGGGPLKTWLNFRLRKTRGLICGLEAVALEIKMLKWVTGMTKFNRNRNEMARKKFNCEISKRY